MALPPCEKCGHGQAGHGGRKCVQYTPYGPNWEGIDDGNGLACGCTATASIDELDRIIAHHEKAIRQAQRQKSNVEYFARDEARVAEAT